MEIGHPSGRIILPSVALAAMCHERQRYEHQTTRHLLAEFHTRSHMIKKSALPSKTSVKR